ncbi:MAG: hypothetical protein C0408_01610 [Odoribacter sp.]|nr:hypothetical protein [Odoribacter sp.]
MKTLAILIIVSVLCIFSSCKKEPVSEQFLLLTGPTWASDSLLAEGVDAGQPGQLLAKFKGDIKFRVDGTGYFGQYTGTWRFSYSETELVIDSDSLQVPLTTNIILLTKTDLKLATSYPNPPNPSNPFDIRMTFKAK